LETLAELAFASIESHAALMTVHTGHLPTPFSHSVPPDRMFRLTVEQYHEMIDRAILTEHDPVELVEGWLVTKMPKNPSHVTATDLTADNLNDLKPSGWSVRRQDPITTGDSEPEPDVVLVRGSRRDFETRHPGPSEIALLVEVADSTLEFDRTTKKRAYARAGVPLYWIVNLIDRTIEVYADPTGPGASPDYRRTVVHRESDVVNLVVDGGELGPIAVRDLLPSVTAD
jgi:Uma2 family endonuclease